MEFIWFWLAKSVAEFALAIGIILAIFAVMLLMALWSNFKYRNCPHDAVWETQACDAICRNCSRNLGFIGTWRERNKP